MNRRFYQLPDPREVGLKWKEFAEGEAKIRGVEGRLRETKRRRAQVEEEIKHLGAAQVTELARAIVAGEDDPAARIDEHETLVSELRELRRQEQALSEALPRIEEQFRLLVYEHQPQWKEEADSALEKAIEAERKALDKALKLIEGPRHKRIYCEALSVWIRTVAPTFPGNADTAALTAIQNLGSGAYNAEEKMRERQRNEQLEAQQEGVA